ncbi:MAG: hypothetical protein GX557_01470, partial [Chloroflexi bacterium]|nr:hypothetical protein [Chloroflexota bacterium]
MKPRRHAVVLAVFLVLGLLTFAGSASGPAAAQGSLGPQQALQAAWQRAREAGSYRFVSTADQTMIPRAVPEMIGQSDVYLTLENDGAVILPDESYTELHVAGADQAQSATLLHSGGQAYMLHDGTLKPVDDTLSLASTTTDVLGYLAAAEEVTLLAPPEGHPELTRYHYVLNGERFEEYVRQQAQQTLQTQPGAPDGIQLHASAALQKLTGAGELWVNRQGYPVRQILDARLPEANEYYGARLHIVVDLSAYGAVEALPRAVQSADGAWHLEGQLTRRTDSGALGPAAMVEPLMSQARTPQTPTALAAWRARVRAAFPIRLAPSSAVLFAAVALAIAFYRLYSRDKRRGYALLIWALVASMVLSPLLQAGQVVNFTERRARAEQSAQDATPDLLSALGLQASASPEEPEAPASAAASARRAPLALSVVPVSAKDRPQDSAGARSFQAGSGASQLMRCGDGAAGVDTDSDGLDDATELCLGTNPYLADSDRDGIDDGTEIAGFDLDLHGTHWDSDPLQPDSNDDGNLDTLEWASSLATNGQATSADLDNDGIPNLWDDDDDGDAVPDAHDLSPFAVSDYAVELNLSTVGDASGGHEFIEVQLQPMDVSHLRYTTTALDWPEDDEGNIQDLNDWSSQDDLRLTPFLIVTTNVAPDATLAEKYGFRSWVDGNGDVIIMAPLLPVQDGGAIHSYYAKIAYAPSQTADIQWHAEMVWMADMLSDQYEGSTVTTRIDTLHEYQDAFRVTGLEVTKDLSYEAAVLGAPAEHDDLKLFKVLLGLNDTFKSYTTLEGQGADQTALEEIAERFAGTGDASVYTFGVEPAAIAVQGPTRYGLLEAGLAGVGSQLIPGFLDTYDLYYGNERCRDASGNAVSCATLIVAFEQSMGALGLDALPVDASGKADLTKLSVNMADVPLVTTRGVQLRMYEQGLESWELATTARALELIEQRYVDSYDTALRDVYPDLTIDDLRFLTYAAYLWAFSPSYRPVAVDGQSMVGDTPDETQLAIDRALAPELEEAATTAVNWFAAGTGIGAALALGGSSYVGWALGDAMGLYNDWSKLSSLDAGWTGLGVGLSAITTGASMVMGIINAICSSGSDLAMCRNEEALKIANIVINSLGILGQAQAVVSLIIQGIRHTLSALSNVAIAVQVVGLIVSIAVTWISFALTLAYGGLENPVVWRMALATAIVTTIYLMVIFVLNCIPIVGQIITAILALIDALLSLFTGLFADQTYTIAIVIMGLFYEAVVCTNVSEATFGEFTTELEDPDLGLVSGNKLKVSLPLEGIIEKTSDGDTDDLERSYIKAKLNWSYAFYTPQELAELFTAQDTSVPGECEIINGVMYCANTAEMSYLLTPKINGAVRIAARADYRIIWAEEGGYGAWRYSTKTWDGTMPEDADLLKPERMYLDVLPADVTALWEWDALENHDPDGDGLMNEQETALGTSPTDWDTDGDGMSDYYEWQSAADLGADPLDADTDNDGLDDDLELSVGTLVNVADSDGDGLLDGEEVRRWQSGAMLGGWQIALSTGIYWVSSDPLLVDADGDGLNDAEEKANGLSPYAPNQPVPALSVSASPVRGVPGGRAGTYWLPGEEIQIDIRLGNGAPNPITTTLTLELPAFLTIIAGGVMQGEATPGLGTSGNTLTWSFTGANALETYETAYATITARTSTMVSGSGDIILRLPYGDIQMRKTIAVVLDGDNPTVAIVSPANGAYLRGSTYVVGGAAWDPTTWVTETSLSIVANGSPASFQALPGAQNPWAYAWTLPGDGVYSLQARATDVMGHQATTGQVNVTVDNTPPGATIGYAMVGNTVHLTGSATDNLAGVQYVRLQIDGQPWRSVELSGSAWTYDWTVGEGAQGEHTVSVRAVDRSGNQSQVFTETIVVDRVAPASSVHTGADAEVPPAVKANTAFTLAGVADEGGHLPEPAVAADFGTGMDVFDDASLWLGVATISENDGGVLAAWIGDMNADRLADLAVGLPGPSGDTGRVAVLYGRAGGWPSAPDLEMLATARTRFAGAAGARLGSLLAAAGDTNGDNMADLLIGERDSTRAFLIFGNPGPLGNVDLDAGQTGYRTLLQAPATIRGLAAAGDVDADGYADLLIRADGTAYLLRGHQGPWDETVYVADEAAFSWSDVTGALGVGDVDGDERGEWVTMAASQVALHGLSSGGSLEPPTTLASADTAPRVAALGDIDGDSRADWIYTTGGNRVLIYGSGAPAHTFSGYDGLVAAPGDVDGDGRADILLATAAGVGTLVHQTGATPEAFATIEGVGGAANAPYATGADLNADGSDELVLIPNEAAAQARGLDAPNLAGGYVSPQALVVGATSGYIPAANRMQPMVQGSGLLSTGPDTRYVDDDSLCDGNSPCYATIQAAVDVTDGGGDTIIVYPGVYEAFNVPADAKYNGLTVEGVSPDAVFVEDSATRTSAITVAADAVRLARMTVRNATIGITLAAGGGEATLAGGSQTVVDHVLAHSVQNALSISQAAAVSVTDSTLVGDGTNAPVYVDPDAAGVHTWTADKWVAQPATASKVSIELNGTLMSAGSSLYAVPGGTSRQVYTSIAGAAGALGDWSAAFKLRHDLPYDTGAELLTTQAAANLLATSGTAMYQLHTNTLWPKLGGMMSHTYDVDGSAVYAVAVSPTTGDVYIGGSFRKVGTLDAFYIARWDGQAWYKVGGGDPLDNGTNGIVRALAFDPSGNLYVGGDFTTAGTLPAAHVARWNGSSWSVLGRPVMIDATQAANGVNGPVYALAYDAESDHPGIFIGGSFTEATEWGGLGDSRAWIPCNNIVRFETVYCTPGPGTLCYNTTSLGANGPVRAIAMRYADYRNDVVFAGNFGTAGAGSYTVSASNIAEYDTQSKSCSAIGTGFVNGVEDITVDPVTGYIYALSPSTEAVRRWNGSSWAQVSGVAYDTNRPRALAADSEGNVYAGADEGSSQGAFLFVQRAGTSGFTAVGRDLAGVSTVSDWISDLAVDASGQLYAATNHVLHSGGTLYESWCALSRWVISGMFKRALPSGSWSRVAYPPTGSDWTAPTAVTGDGAGNLYAVWGSYTTGVLYYYNATANTWTAKAAPSTTLSLEQLTWADGKLYAVGTTSGGVWSMVRYDPTANSWTARSAPPVA